MHCIVTAGPSAEPLDEVRRLTNLSTGRLGTGLALSLAARGAEVTLVRSELATSDPVAPGGGIRAVRAFTTSEELRNCLVELSGPAVDAVFHVAAVSDFRFGRVYARTASGGLEEREERKLRAESGDLLVELRPTPKLIAGLAGWFPRAFLVGWKYELNGGREEAIAAARAQLSRYGTHACVVNGKAYGDGYGIVTGTGCEESGTAEELYSRLWAKWNAWHAELARGGSSDGARS